MTWDRLAVFVVPVLFYGLCALAIPARADPPMPITVTQSVDTLVAATDKVLTGTGQGVKMLCIQNIGTGQVTLAFGVAAVAGSGWPLAPAAVAGQAGGSICWTGQVVPRDIVHAISAAGSTVVTLAGRS